MERVNILEIDLDDWTYTFRGAPFSGVAFELGPGGELIAELTFVNAYQEGPVRYWYRSGAKLEEYSLRRGAKDGAATKWFESGQLNEQAHYELGILLECEIWNEDGILTSQYQLEETDDNFRLLQRFRSLKWKD